MSIWDTFSQDRSNIRVNLDTVAAYKETSVADDQSSLYSGKIACDSYYKAEYDSQVRLRLICPRRHPWAWDLGSFGNALMREEVLWWPKVLTLSELL